MTDTDIPELKTEDEFHKWCLNKPLKQKVQALVDNWDQLIGGESSLRPLSFAYSPSKEVGTITYEVLNEQQTNALSNFQKLYKIGISNSNLPYLAPGANDPAVAFGPEHGYLTTLLGIALQNRFLFL